MAANRMVKLALIQMKGCADKAVNLLKAKSLIKTAASNEARLVCLPECFNSPYGSQYFQKYAEDIPGETSQTLSQLSKEFSVYLCSGSIPEREDGKLYNTSLVFDPSGKIIAKHRKVHLFDIDVPGGIKFTESEVLSAGDKLTTFFVDDLKVGLGICYDIRFAEMTSRYAADSCQLMLFPAAFNMTTGPQHFQLLQRARALDHQVYVATCSPARDVDASYVAWGYSAIVDPWAQVIAEAGHEEEIIYGDIDTSIIDTVRTAIPILKQKRPDVYQ